MILQRLRAETRAEHEALEGHIDLLGRPWSMDFYRRLLEKFYGFYAVIEPPLFSRPEWQPLGVDVGKRLKLPLLVEDLKFLGLGEAEIEELPRCANAPSIATFPQALGAAYVLEGSTLGGQIITRHLKKELGVEVGRGISFFMSYGAEVGPMWRQFTSVLDSFDGDAGEMAEIVDTAGATFRTFDEWLTDIL
jgi:heme oxygenase